jgi:hypothetical protein
MAGEEQDLIKRADAFIDAFNAGDWQRFAVNLAPDLVYEETGTQRRTESVDEPCRAAGYLVGLGDERCTVRGPRRPRRLAD